MALPNRLRKFLIIASLITTVVIVVGISVAWIVVMRAEPERLTVVGLEAKNAGLYYDYHTGGICVMGGHPSAPPVLLDLLGLHAFHHVIGVGFMNDKFDDNDVRNLRNLPDLEWVMIDSSNVTDRSVDEILLMPNIRYVSLRGTSVSASAVKELNAKVPECFIHYVDDDGEIINWSAKNN